VEASDPTVAHEADWARAKSQMAEQRLVGAPDTPEVRIGQVWADNDKRGYGRRVRVIAIEPAQPGGPHKNPVPARAVVELVDARKNWPDTKPGRRTRIRLDRFRPTSTGYRLVSDAPTSERG
jgi:hypothetical protein